MTLVTGYGLHRQDDLVFLHEQDNARCLTPGLEQLESPFEVIRMPRQRCPHILPHSQEGGLVASPLLRIMSPHPHRGLYWVDSRHIQTVFSMAEHMTRHPFDPPVFGWPTLTVPIRTLMAKLTLTNCVPLVVHGYGPRDFRDVIALAALPRTRALVLLGYPQVPGSVDISPSKSIDYSPEELWELSAAFLHAWIKKVTQS